MQSHDGWIGTKEAMRILHVSRSGLYKLAKRGIVGRRHTADGGGNGSTYYSFKDVAECSVSSARSRRRHRRHDDALPLFPPDTDWISMREAAEILGVQVTRVWRMIKMDILPCRREGGDGKPVRLWLSRQQLERHRDDPERRTSRMNYEKHRRLILLKRPAPLTEDEKAALQAKTWLTVAEAARVLEIAPVTVYWYNTVGRLPGYRRLPDAGVRRLRLMFLWKDVDAFSRDPKRQAYQALWREAFRDEAVTERANAWADEIYDFMARIHGWNRPDYEPTYQGSPGGVW